MKRLLIFLSAISFVLIMTAVNGSNSAQVVGQTAPGPSIVEAEVLEGKWVEGSNKCLLFYTCLYVELKLSKSCSNPELNFEILDSNSKKVASAVVASAGIRANEKTVREIGYNNKVSEQTRLTFPIVRCLSQESKYKTTRAMYNFPANFCSENQVRFCMASGPTGQEIDANPDMNGLVDSPGVTGNGYSVTCKDGWRSNSGGIQGACSHHGGVAY